MEKALKFILKNKDTFIVIAISVAGLIIGSVALDFWISLLVIGVLNVVFFATPLINKKKRKRNKNNGKNTKKKSSDTKKTGKNDKNKAKKIIKYLLICFFTLIIIIIICSSIFMFIIVKNAPDFDPNKLYKKEASIIYDNQGNIITKIGEEMREKITFEEMPEVLVDAIIATEDSRFFQHNGFDLPRFLKAAFGQVLGKRDAGGASTLTMQIAKNHYTSTESSGIKGIIRKFTDIYLSIFKIEKNYTKFEILEFYVNSNYLGGSQYGGAYGVEQASQLYFGKNAKDLTLPEAALIAGLFQAPNSYDPYLYPDRTEERRKTVLYLMERHRYITSEEREIAEQMTVHDLVIEHEKNDDEYVGIINTVTAEVIRLTGQDPFTVAMEIYTTFDLEKQQHINKVLSGELYTWENDVVDAGIAVLDVNTGGIVAVSPGRHKTNLKGFNLAADIKRHIGSTAKPLYDYGPGIEFNNWSTYHPFIDEPHAYSTGIPINNWDFKYVGITTLREALRTSKNIPALKAFQSLNNKDIYKFVTSLGLNPELENGLVHEAHALGSYTGESPVSLAAAYASFANGGYYIEPHSVTKIIYRDTNEVFENKVKKEKVMSESTAYMISHVLLDAARWGLYGNYNVNGVSYCAKTGTSNFPPEVFEKYNLPSNAVNDLWIAAYTPDYAIAQWYGYDEISSEYYNKFGSSYYRALFQTVAKGIFKENKSFQKPKDVVEVNVEKDTIPAMLPSEFTPKDMIVTELFKKGTEPTEVSSRYARLKNPSNLQAKEEDSMIKLTWDPIEIPSAIDENELSKFFAKYFSDEAERKKHLNDRISYNKKYIGELGYEVYIKNGDKLELLGFTKNNYFTTPSTPGTVTYVVKSAYSIFKDNMSTGVETTLVQTGNQEVIDSHLIGDSVVELNVGDNYEEPFPAVNVTENMDNVTHLATITEIITEESSGNKVENIDTSKPNTYIITYEISYKSYSKTHTRKIIIK